MAKLINRFFAAFNKYIVSKVMHAILRKLCVKNNIRFIDTNPAAIGHLTLDVDCFLKERELGLHSFTGILLSPRSRTSNNFLLECWETSPHIYVLRNTLVCYFLDYLRTFSDTGFNCARYTALREQPLEVFQISERWGNDLPLIDLPKSVEIAGRNLFFRLFPHYKGEPIAILHCRDSKYDLITNNIHFTNQNHRNCDVRSFDKILDFLNAHDFICVRIGDYFVDGIEDERYYSLQSLENEDKRLLECYLAKYQTLYLGANSGAVGFPSIWNKPIFLLNMLPIQNLRSTCINSIAIPKILRRNGSVMKMKEIYDKALHRIDTDAGYAAENLTFEQNKPEEVFDDFLFFFDKFVKNTTSDQAQIQDGLNKKYREVVDAKANDSYAVGLVGALFLEKNNLI